MDSEQATRVRDKIQLMLRQMDTVLRTTRDPGQKKRVSLEISRLRKDLVRLEEKTFTDEDARLYIKLEAPAGGNADDGDDEGQLTPDRYPVLSSIEITPAGPECAEPEINAIASFLRYFEAEHLSILGNYQLKLDFNNAQRRDTYFNLYSGTQQVLKSYLDVIHDIAAGRIASGDHADSLRQMRRKLHMDYVIKTADFVHGLLEFITLLLDDCKNGGNLILNPDQVMEFDKIHGTRELDGLTVATGLERIRLFLSEFGEYLNIPGLKKMQSRG